MKLIIDVAEKYYEACKDAVKESYPSQIEEIIANGIPYNPSGDLISRSEAEKLGATCLARRNENEQLEAIISLDNAPTIEFPPVINMKPLTAEEKQGLINALKKSGLNAVKLDDEGIQGECKSCRHRDPEDQKCDCGAKERQGCPFPVSDDYFCKFYEKGGDNT